MLFFFIFFHGNFRPDGSERDAPLYNGFFPKKSGAARFVNTIRSISILFKFFIPILSGQKLTLGNYLQCNQGPVVQKPINANPRLKVNQ